MQFASRRSLSATPFGHVENADNGHHLSAGPRTKHLHMAWMEGSSNDTDVELVMCP